MKPGILVRSVSFHSPLTHFRIGSGSGSGSDNSGLHRTRSIGFAPTRSSLHLDLAMDPPPPALLTSPIPLRRARSDTDLVAASRIGSRWTPPSTLAEEEEEEEMAFFGGGSGSGKKIGSGDGGGGRGGGGGGGDGENNKRIGNYYQEMLKSDPGNPLLLRNYGRFLHEVEGDSEGAEECYGRAILANPGDGDVLSLYGKLVWETHRDEQRATSYYERAVQASPDDCYVLGSYASFLWDTEEEEDCGEEDEKLSPSTPSPLVKAF